ncbi:uncharacterized protein LOC142609252 [Castanea sativa]|uniref:uncharacterized protein LOC142609252 n=1 Tax=Castanea sativa TaxID=21020 RepID=UPI003F64F54A
MPTTEAQESDNRSEQPKWKRILRNPNLGNKEITMTEPASRREAIETEDLRPVKRQAWGGLVLYWKDEINLHVLNSSPTFIEAVVNPGLDDARRFTGFYGNPVTANREYSWALLKHICLQMDLPWFCIGEFNVIVKSEEKMGGASRPERQMVAFREALDSCGVRDLGFVGSPFTWCNNQFNGGSNMDKIRQRGSHAFLDSDFPIGACPSYCRLLGQKKKSLAQAEAILMMGSNHEQVRILRGEVYDLMVKEECLWHQRSRVNWLQSGDLNTSYFHSRANQRNRRNYISKLFLDDGTCVEEEQKVGEVLVEYFKDLFTPTNPSNFESILHGIESKVTPTMNAELTREFKAEEVEQALTQMKPMTAQARTVCHHSFINLIGKLWVVM